MQFGIGARKAFDLSALRTVVGFACNQAFIFSLIYLGQNYAIYVGNFVFERADLFLILLCTVLSFGVLRISSSRARDALLVRSLLWCYAGLAVLGSFVPFVTGVSVFSIVIEGILVGLSAGFMEIFVSNSGQASVPLFTASLFLLILFCIAACQLISGGSVKSNEADEQGPLDGVYRLAVLVIMVGFLFVPVLGNTIEFFELSGQIPYAVVAFAGVSTLYAYLFLFTERDFHALSVIIRDADRFGDACRSIAEKYALSKRESEILPFVLRGRTGEWIAGELFISKSTVDTHLKRIYAKTGTHGRQELIDLGEYTEHHLE